MEEVRRVLRPWPERMTASAPLLIPALSLLCACAAMDVSLWFWIPCFCLASLPCFLRAPSMGVLAVALAMWAAVYLFAYDGNTQAFPWKRGESWLWKAPLRLFPENPCCFARMVPGGCTRFPPVTGPALWRQGNATGSGERRIRFRRRAVPASLTGSVGGTCTASSPESGWMSTAGTGRETGAAVSGLFPCGSGKGLPPCSGRAPLRMMRPGR